MVLPRYFLCCQLIALKITALFDTNPLK